MPSDVPSTAYDIRCGRGSSRLDNVGNQRYMSFIMASLPHYREAKTKVQKSVVIDAILEQVRISGGQFVKLDKNSSQWNQDLADKQAKQKIGASLRRFSQLAIRPEEAPRIRDLDAMTKFVEKQASLRELQLQIFYKSMSEHGANIQIDSFHQQSQPPDLASLAMKPMRLPSRHRVRIVVPIEQTGPFA